MAVNFGDNSSRYYSVPDHDDFTLPATGNWTWLAVVRPNFITVNSAYLVCTNSDNVASGFNLHKRQSGHQVRAAVSGKSIWNSAPLVNGEDYLMFASCNGNAEFFSGFINLNTQTASYSALQNQQSIANGNKLYIGASNSIGSTLHWRGGLSWLCLLNKGLTQQELEDLADQTKYLVAEHGGDIVELWDFATASETIVGLYNGHVATRIGTGYGSDLPDVLPFDEPAPPEPPAGTVTVTNVTPGSNSATVTYSYTASDQTGFQYRIDNGGAASIGASPALITGLSPDTNYNSPGLQVRAINGAGESAWSTAVPFSTEEAPSGEIKGIRVVLHDRANLSPRTNITGIVARWWDAPSDSGAPVFETTTAQTNGSGLLELDLDSETALNINDLGYLTLYKQGASPADDWHFAARIAIEDIA